MKNTFLILLVFLILLSCKKETVIETKTIYEDSQYSWKPAEWINKQGKYVTNCFWDDESILFSTSNSVFRYDNGKVTNPSYAAELFHRKRAMSRNYFTEFTQTAFWIKNLENPSMSRATFSSFGEERWWMGVGYVYYNLSHVSAINESENQFLVSISADSSVAGGVDFILADFEEGDFLINIDENLIRVAEGNSLLETYFVDSHFDKFFAGTSNGLIVIEPNGEWQWGIYSIPSYVINEMFRVEQDLYVVGHDIIYKSSDMGLNWAKVYETNGSLFKYNFYVFDSLIVVSSGDKLGQLILDESSMEIIPLKSDGLKFNTITDMGLHNDTVYVTTKSGIFFKRLEDLIEYE